MTERIITNLIINLILASNCLGQANSINSNLIEWNLNEKIKWDNFQEPPDSASSFETGFSPFIKSFYYVKNDSVFCRIITFFNPKKAWKKLNSDDYGLQHEQIHFDITEVFARKIRQEIILSNIDSRNEETIQRLYYDYVTACNSFQVLYDRQTNHSLNRKIQDKWNKKIEALLLSLNEYSEQSIYIKHPVCKICWK